MEYVHSILSYMAMRKQMILTILIITVAFGTETEFQVRIILIGLTADGAFVFGDFGISLNVMLELRPPFDLLGIQVHMAPASQEENQEI